MKYIPETDSIFNAFQYLESVAFALINATSGVLLQSIMKSAHEELYNNLGQVEYTNGFLFFTCTFDSNNNGILYKLDPSNLSIIDAQIHNFPFNFFVKGIGTDLILGGQSLGLYPSLVKVSQNFEAFKNPMIRFNETSYITEESIAEYSWIATAYAHGAYAFGARGGTYE